MRHALRLAAAISLTIAALAAVAASASAAVFGNDDRVKLTHDDQALKEKIGTLSSSKTGAFCTAFCVAPDMIATASHCLFGTDESGQPSLRDLTFKTAASPQSAGTPLASKTKSGHVQIVISGTARLSVTPPISAASDWAIARLALPACHAGGLALSTRPRAAIDAAAARGEIYQIAVHADLPDTAMRRGGPCPVHTSFAAADEDTIARDFTNTGAILFHTCDTGGGSSGSPLLIDTAAGPEVVAINVGTYILSRAVTATGIATGQDTSEPIANTAIAISAVSAAVSELAQHPALTPAAKPVVEKALLRRRGVTHRLSEGQEYPSASRFLSR